MLPHGVALKGFWGACCVLKGVSGYGSVRRSNVVIKINTLRVKIFSPSLVRTNSYNDFTWAKTVVIICRINRLTNYNRNSPSHWYRGSNQVGTLWSTNTPRFTFGLSSHVTSTDSVYKRYEIKHNQSLAINITRKAFLKVFLFYLYNVYCTRYIVHSILVVHGILYKRYCIVYCKRYGMLYTIYCIHYTVYMWFYTFSTCSP